MRNYVTIFFLLVFSKFVTAQFIADSNFQWQCLIPVEHEYLGKDYYLKALNDSTIKLSARKFATIVHKYAPEILEDTVQNETIKLKFIVLKDGNAFPREIGLIHSSSYNETAIKELINSLNPFTAARHRDLNVNSLGILYLEYKNGVLKSHRLVNVNLTN